MRAIAAEEHMLHLMGLNSVGENVRQSTFACRE